MVNYIAKNVLLQDIDTKEYLIPYTENKLPIGTIIPCLCSSSWTPQGTLPLDGAEYSSTQFPSLWSNYLITLTTEDSDTSEAPKLVTCTYDEYSSDITTYGQCAKFAVDTTNNKFKVPTIKDGSYITQALSDSELSKAYNESLPNIKGTFYGGLGGYTTYGTGAFYEDTSAQATTDSYGAGGNITKNRFGFNASRSSSTYQDGAKVQGDNVRLRWFVVVANGTVSQSAMDWSAWATGLNGRANTDLSNLSEDGTQIIKTVSQEELNNPFSLFDSKYSDHELNNLSWLKSAGQWNAKAVYPTAYDKLLKVYNGTETVEGLSVKLSTETYTDYDFVLNTANETFRLPLKNGDEHAIADNAVNIGTIQSGYVFDSNCIVYFRYGGNGNTPCQVFLNNIEVNYFNYTGNTSAYGVSGTFRANRGDVLTYTGVKPADNMLIVNEMVGNGSLYYYIGETVQNANLIDAGRIGEQISKLVTVVETYVNGTSWYRVWSDGWCEQGGVVTSTSGRRNVTLLKPYSDSNYNVQQTILNATANGQLQPFTEAIQSKTIISFSVYCDSAIAKRMWKACGYMRTTSGGTSGGSNSGGSVPDKTEN